MVCWTISECQKNRYCKMFTTVSWVSGVCWVMKELIVSWFLCQSYQVRFSPKHSAHPRSLPHPHWPQCWGRGIGVEVPDFALHRPLWSFHPIEAIRRLRDSEASPNWIGFSKYVFTEMYVGRVFWETTIYFMALKRKNNHIFLI